ncbi:MAG TPA: hypothetical protein VIU34_31970 [Steroidobacter sp.]
MRIAIQEWRASKDGAYLAYAVQDGGSDWRTIRVLDVATGQTLADELKWARLTQIAWAKDGSGFYYSRYPEPTGGSDDDSGLVNHAVYFHRGDASAIHRQHSVRFETDTIADFPRRCHRYSAAVVRRLLESDRPDPRRARGAITQPVADGLAPASEPIFRALVACWRAYYEANGSPALAR